QMGQAYPELIRAEAVITETFKLEETRFKQMLDRGLRLLDDETARLGAGQKLPGEVAFKLYDTFGFPLDLTEDILRGQNRSVEIAGFDAAMEHQRDMARKAWSGSGEAATEAVWFNLREKLGASDFLGYATEKAEGQITAILKNGQETDKAVAGDEVAVIANQTPFYGESGGQMGDTGTIVTLSGGAGGEIAVTDTQKKLGDMVVHFGKVTKGTVSRGEAAEFRVDGKRRAALRAHHSSTHLLHEALRRRLGAHVTQKGSLVAPDRLRFDFSHPRSLTAEDLAVVERDVNERIRKNAAVETHLMTPDAAIEAGALALFGEKYGEEVRVVSMGGRFEDEARNFSTELCGGTHVQRTGDIGLFKIIGEGAVASGVRRIEAVTGAAAEAYIAEQQRLLTEAAAALKTLPSDLASRITSLVEEKKKLERDLTEARKAAALAGSSGVAASNGSGTKDVNGVKFTSRVLSGVPAKELKSMADELKKQIGSGVVVLISADEGKASLVVGVTADLTGKVSAVDLVKTGSAALGGQGGGGRPDMAQAGGPDAGKAEDALAAIEKAIGATAQAA
ncbi:MAG: alanine--tRNA ligase, partial [Dongiaceae bacterium]